MRRLCAIAVTSLRTTGNHPTTMPPPPPPHSPEEQPATIASTTDAAANASANTMGTSTVVIAARNILAALSPCKPVELGISQVSSFPQAQLSPSLAATSITTAQPISAGNEFTTQASQAVQGPSGGSTTAANTAASSNVVAQKDNVPVPTHRPSVSSGGRTGAAAAAAAADVPTTPDESRSSTGTNTGAGSGAGTAVGDGSHSGPGGNGERRRRAFPVVELLVSCVVWEGEETRTE